jgi:hypothetical protein
LLQPGNPQRYLVVNCGFAIAEPSKSGELLGGEGKPGMSAGPRWEPGPRKQRTLKNRRSVELEFEPPQF